MCVEYEPDRCHRHQSVNKDIPVQLPWVGLVVFSAWLGCCWVVFTYSAIAARKREEVLGPHRHAPGFYSGDPIDGLDKKLDQWTVGVAFWSHMSLLKVVAGLDILGVLGFVVFYYRWPWWTGFVMVGIGWVVSQLLVYSLAFLSQVVAVVGTILLPVVFLIGVLFGFW